jgi:hypothetical protein
VSATVARFDVGERPEAPELGHRVNLLLQVAIVACFVGIVVLRPALPHNTALVDPLLAALSIGALLSMHRWGSPATEAAAKSLPWIWLIIVGSFIGLAGVGMAFWGVSDLAVSLFALLTFYIMWHLLYVHHLERCAVWGTAIGLGITTFTVVTDGRLRNSGLFAQPNYPAHYAVLAAIVLVYGCRHRWAKALTVLAVLVIIKETGSFGSLVMVGTVFAVLGYRAAVRHSAVLAAGLIAFFVAGLYVVSNYVTTGASGLNTRVPTITGTGINQARFDKSKGNRFQLWSDDIHAWIHHPMGLGPAGVLNRKISYLLGQPLQVHNDPLSFLVERGPIGLIGFIGFWVVLWRCAPPKGLARLTILVILMGSLVRQTMHYRHVWLLLAVVFVFDNRRTDLLDEPEPDDLADPAEQRAGPDGGWMPFDDPGGTTGIAADPTGS